MHYLLPKLKYSIEALEPVISSRTLKYHYYKHEQAYIDNVNRLIAGTNYADMDLESIIRNSAGALFNNASQAWNHIFYFFALSPKGGGMPAGALRLAIDDSFDSFDNFKDLMIAEGNKLFGSGWVWLVKTDSDRLMIESTNNADSPLTFEGITPLMCIDVWEHAYYLDYQNRRNDYMNRIWDIIDWNFVESRYLD